MPYVWVLIAESEDLSRVWIYSWDNRSQAITDAKEWMGKGYFMTLSTKELIQPGMTQEDVEFYSTLDDEDR